MMALRLSPAAANLFSALKRNAGCQGDSFRLIDYTARPWHSATFSGERHKFSLRIAGHLSVSAAASLLDGIADYEFSLPHDLVAEIVAEQGSREPDGSITVGIEALTISVRD